MRRAARSRVTSSRRRARLNRTITIFAAALLTGCATPPAATPVQRQDPGDQRLPRQPEAAAGRHPHQGPGRRRQDASTCRPAAPSTWPRAVAELRAKNPNHIFVAAGDLIGASPLLSALFHDEPTVEALGPMGLEVSAVGNHEFDQGATELLRMQSGGCHPVDGCKGPQPFEGAQLPVPGGEHGRHASGKTLFPAYHVKRFQGIPVAFIGLTLKDTPQHRGAGRRGRAAASATRPQTVNALVPELRRQGIEAIVVLIHEGGVPDRRLQRVPGHLRADRRHREEARQGGRRGDQRPHAPRLQLPHRRPAGDQRRQVRHHRDARSTWCSTRRPAT